jgi:hypothetical protein
MNKKSVDEYHRLQQSTMFEDVKDTGNRRTFASGAVRDRSVGKGRFDLIPPIALFRLAKHYENGARKYCDRNWEKGMPLSQFLDSAGRHWTHVAAGHHEEDHIAAVIWNMVGFMWTWEEVINSRLPEDLVDIPAWREYLIEIKIQKVQDAST